MNGLLVCKGGSRYHKNIGDYIQSVAQELFFDHIDCYIERERTDEVDYDDRVNLIMNGWFMFHPEHFPPSDQVNPLYISFHLVQKRADKILSEKAIKHLKKYEPIGARDYSTMHILEEHGIKSYFSSCLTLTLGLKYKSEVHNDEVCFVDPYYEFGNGGGKYKKYLEGHYLLFRHWSKVWKMKQFRNEKNTSIHRYTGKFDRHFMHGKQSWIDKIAEFGDRLLMCASFYDAYSKCFDDDVLLNAVYIRHNVKKSIYRNEDEMMEYARSLIMRYAKAKLVVTSRIHCAIPCLGVETPVIFVISDALENGRRRSAGRFGGNLELLHQLRWTPDQGVISETPYMNSILQNGKISPKTEIVNKEDYKPLAKALAERVYRFLGRL